MSQLKYISYQSDTNCLITASSLSIAIGKMEGGCYVTVTSLKQHVGMSQLNSSSYQHKLFYRSVTGVKHYRKTDFILNFLFVYFTSDHLRFTTDFCDEYKNLTSKTCEVNSHCTKTRHSY